MESDLTLPCCSLEVINLWTPEASPHVIRKSRVSMIAEHGEAVRVILVCSVFNKHTFGVSHVPS